MEIKINCRQKIKAFFKEGKPCLILKLNIPIAEGENEEFNLRFGEFYGAVESALFKAGERAVSEIQKKPDRPISLTLNAEQKSTPVGEIFITRSLKMRMPSGKTQLHEAHDIFDAETGLLIKEKRRRVPKKHTEPRANGFRGEIVG